ncbi:MAG: bifunctional class I SAM-dependent methyltransferase/glycosyltransferase family 2 protein [Actinomycetia bacterium]|nr:bifunctional class I SAM-dependent methyltransferase/glycosyltransferase family 2 protein [Actinomycetes bacterium]
MTYTLDRSTDAAFSRYQQRRIAHWDDVATHPVAHNQAGYYADRLQRRYGQLIPPGLRILEIGCGRGDLLASLRPSRGVGIDFSPEMVAIASTRHPDLEILKRDAHDLGLDGTFDVIILSDLVNDLWDVQTVLEQVQVLCDPSTRVILNFYSKLWQGPLGLVRRLGLANPVLAQNWLTPTDMDNLLHLSGFERVTSSREILLPVRLGPISDLMNRITVRIWPFNHAAVTNFIVARPRPDVSTRPLPQSVSVIVPARNEAGNIDDIVRRTPQMGSGTELVFVEGNSTDDTYDTIERVLAKSPSGDMMLLRQPGKGKGDAVRFGYAHASGDILMILDADMTVAPEELPRFYEAINDGTGEFINGVRLVYPMEGEAMQFLNYLGNKFFGIAFSWLLQQPTKDTLCGTKVLTRESYDLIAANRSYFGDFDPFGDFDLLFGAAKLNLKIVDMPVRYRDRTYGSTNINRWSHGVLLIRMAAFAARKLRFI